ncbi:hypothetical protein D3C86_1505600 [compost metagenome]
MVVLLFIAGLQVPVMPLLEVVGNAASGAPAQIAGTWVNNGVALFTTIVIVAVAAHCPAVGVKVYVVVVLLLIVAGLHVPVTPLLEVVGNGATVAPWHIGPTCVNEGTVLFTTTVRLTLPVAHCPGLAVKV